MEIRVDSGFLEIKKETFLVLAYHDLEKLIKMEYDIDYEYPADEEVSNDIHKLYSGINGKHLDSYDTSKLERFISSEGKEGMFMARCLLSDLALRGKIPCGDYLIDISW